MSSHTPGPWRRESIFWILQYAEKHPEIHKLDSHKPMFDDEHEVPSSRDVALIASAPELLKALENVLYLAVNGDRVPAEWEVEFAALIARARGEE